MALVACPEHSLALAVVLAVLACLQAYFPYFLRDILLDIRLVLVHSPELVAYQFHNSSVAVEAFVAYPAGVVVAAGDGHTHLVVAVQESRERLERHLA